MHQYDIDRMSRCFAGCSFDTFLYNALMAILVSHYEQGASAAYFILGVIARDAVVCFLCIIENSPN
jgi:hypothetical protein